MLRLVRLMVFVPALFATAVAALAQQPARFEDVVRNLRNPDQKVRISAVRLLRETGTRKRIVPLAAAVNDQVNAIQLEAIDAELSFFLVEPLSTKKHVALVVEVRTEGRAPSGVRARARSRCGPRRCPPSSSTRCCRPWTTRTRRSGSRRFTRSA